MPPDPRVPTRDPRTYHIIGAAMTVHRTLGRGFLESVYRDALAIELASEGIPFDRERPCDVTYRGHVIGRFRVDFICHSEVVIEVKARGSVGLADDAQVLNYLAATGLRVGLLLNFGGAQLDYRRLVLNAE